MIVDFSTIDAKEQPLLILRNANGTALGVLANAISVQPRLLYNEVSELNFELPAYADGVATPMYDEVVGMRVVDLRGVGQFTLIDPVERGDGVTLRKVCKAYSLEYEFAYKNITIPNGTYKFYDYESPEDTLLGMLLDGMPSWSVGSVPATILNKYRTFEVTGEKSYNFIKSTVQRTYGCIFNFDTYNRKIYIDDAERTPTDKPVFISTENLAKEIEVNELTSEVVTRLDVNGAEGVSIRDVNPNGTNWLLNLDHYMTTRNFDQDLIDKYYGWLQLIQDNRDAFYVLSVHHTGALERKAAALAKLTDLNGEMASLQNLQAVTIQAIAQALKAQTDLDAINTDITAKQKEIDAQNALIEELTASADNLLTQLQTIRDTCSYDLYFTEAERIAMDKYIKDDSVSDASFVAATTSFSAEGFSREMSSITLEIDKTSLSQITPASGGSIYDIKGGTLVVSDVLSASIMSGSIDELPGQPFVASFCLKDVVYAGEKYPQGCLTITGVKAEAVINAYTDQNYDIHYDSVVYSGTDVHHYFTLNVSEYEKRSIAWELYEYGKAALDKLSRPSYTFSVKSANFLVHEDFVTFRNALRLGERIYISPKPGNILKPVCLGVTFVYDDPSSFELLFSDKYVSGEDGNKLFDLLEQSVSMGKTVNANQFNYNQFVESGANTSIAQFMNSALDVAKNALFSSTGNAVTMDGSGIRLRRWTDDSHTAYEPEQQWLVNNSIVMTADNWATAQMAIGKFSDPNLGDCWGIVAPMVVGTMLAGTKLIIESEKKDGDIAVFRVDEDGARLYNSNFLIANDQRSILLHPDVGMVIGPIPSYSIADNGSYTVDKDVANFYVDNDGNVFLRGAVIATELHIGNQTIKEYITENSGKAFYQASAPTSGFAVGDTWRDSDSPYHYLYTAVSTTGDPAKDWVLVSAQAIEGAAINTNANTGVIDIVAASKLNLTSGGVLSIAGTGAINLSSTGGINLYAGQITLGSAANTLQSAGILSLANGNILLHGPNNEVTIGKGGGTVNIGTDGAGTINLATYQVKSSTKTTPYTATYQTGGAATSASTSTSVPYTTTDVNGNQSSASLSVTTSYTKASALTNDPPSITDGRLLQIVYSDRGINIFADTTESEMILAPSIASGHLMGWGLVSADNVAAQRMSAASLVASSMFVSDGSGGLVSVADQKWTIDKIMEILNNQEILPSLKTAQASLVLKASKEEVTSVATTVSTVQADLDAAEAAITLKADRTVTDDLTTRMNTAEADINAAEAAISLKASQSSVTDLTSRVSTAEADIDAAEAAIALKASQTTVDEQGELISTVQADLDAAEAAITLKASQSDMDDVFLRLDAAEGSLTVQAEEIRLKADKTYVDDLYAGTVKTDELEAELADVIRLSGGVAVLDRANISTLLANTVQGVDSISGNYAWFGSVSADSITVGDNAVATQAWVENKGYVTASTSSLTNYYTKNEVYSADETFTLIGTYLESYGYATQDWVTENFSNARTTYSPASIERYGTVSGTTIPVRTLNASGTELLTGSVDAGDVYTAGQSAGNSAGRSAERTTCYNNLALMTTGSFARTGNSVEYVDGYIGFVGSDGKSYTKSLSGIKYDATAVYDDGYADAVDSATFSVDGTNVVVTFGDGSTKSFNVDSYVSAQGETKYVSSTDTTITVRANAHAYFNGVYCGTWSAQGTYDTV